MYGVRLRSLELGSNLQATDLSSMLRYSSDPARHASIAEGFQVPLLERPFIYNEVQSPKVRRKHCNCRGARRHLTSESSGTTLTAVVETRMTRVVLDFCGIIAWNAKPAEPHSLDSKLSPRPDHDEGKTSRPG